MHSHSYCGLTTLEQWHVHHYAGATSIVRDTPGHTHHIEGETTFDQHHNHHYNVETSPAIYLPYGGHYHYYKARVAYKNGHRHTIFGITSVN